MGKITQTKIIDDIIRNNINGGTVYSKEDGNVKILFQKDGVGVGEENGNTFLFKKDNLIILPYFLNIYDELESFLCMFKSNKIHNIDGCYAISMPVENELKPSDTLGLFLKDIGIEMDQNEMLRRVRQLEPVFISDNLFHKTYPFFIDMTDLSYDTEKARDIVNIDVFSIGKYQIRDMNLLYMLSIIKEIS